MKCALGNPDSRHLNPWVTRNTVLVLLLRSFGL